MSTHPVFAHGIATAVPEGVVPQEGAREVLKRHFGDDRLLQRLVHRLYSQSGIETRYTVVPDFVFSAAGAAGEPVGGGAFYDAHSATYKAPSTKVRNDLYTAAARPLFKAAAERVLEATPGLGARDITHVVTVSCTGFFAPGPDYFLVKDLCLHPHVQRFHLGFMGCYAAFPALKMARAFCQADPEAVVLVVCAELCTLHMQLGSDLDRLLAGSVFADGAAAALVSARAPQGGEAFELSAFATTLTPVGEADMAWSVGDEGFDIVLSSYVPDILEANIASAVAPLLGAMGLSQAEVQHWGVHPGGRAILDKVEKGLALPAGALAPSREVLRDYGNMSSATVLFVLQKIAARAESGERVCAMAFGPGLTVESGLLTKA
ncbi:type III polyketide synthase [Truepera radiovictrix]|uniref:type III polyketide synthase n=1 Tax=Truepera radiovictrix TaxID=332249 RepID=UPI0005A51E6F|nr:type III polyketide synthase [Truepera radiovictrix]WMT56141.1 type III polyketide synthase [Truepera radiovictrix]